MRKLTLLLAALLVGCADYGVSRYSIEPAIVNNQAVCCKVSLINGKEIGHIKVHLEKKDGYWLIDLDERDVKSFEGQQAVTSAVSATATSAVEAATNVLIAPTVVPVANALIKGVVQ